MFCTQQPVMSICKSIHSLAVRSYTHCGKVAQPCSYLTILGTKYSGIVALGTRHLQTAHSSPKGKNDTSQEDEITPRTNVTSSEEAFESVRLQKIKSVMRSYLKNAQEQASAMKQLEDEFEIGRRHLANMMGADPNTFTQRDIDKAIEYLMPSGLFEPTARPLMKPPKELYPPKQGIELDETGRPLNVFVYTEQAHYYSRLHSITKQFEILNQYEDAMISRGFASPPPETKLALNESEWISLNAMRKLVMDDKLPESDYKYMIETLERLVEHPYSFRIKDYIMKYRVDKTGIFQASTIPPLTVGEDGIPYAQAQGKRKWTRAEVTVRGKGTGEVNINGMDIRFFPLKQDREQLLFPLKFTGLLNKVDFEATVTGEGGHTAEAGAIRYGLSKALASFVSPDMVEKMRLAGLMQWDVRTRERKKPGQKGARAKFKWVKR